MCSPAFAGEHGGRAGGAGVGARLSLFVRVMSNGDRRIVVIARLKPKPLLAGAIVCALILAALALGQAEPVRGDGMGAMLRSLIFGDAVATTAMIAAAIGLSTCFRLWRQRDAWIFHDGLRLYRGNSLSWPLATIRDVVIERSDIGIASLRLVVDDDSETTRELVKLPLLEGSPEAVRGGVLFAAAGVKAVSSGITVN